MTMRVANGQQSNVPGGHRARNLTFALTASLIFSLLAGGLWPVQPAAAQDLEPFSTASVVPDDVLVYTVVPLDPGAEQWAIGRDLLRRAGLGTGANDLGGDLLGEAEDLPFDMFLGGEIALVMTDTSVELFMQETLAASQGEAASFAGIDRTGLAAILTTPSPDIIAASAELAVSDTAQAEGVEVQQADYEGVTIHYVELPSGSDATPLATARVDDFILVAGFPVDLEPLIDTSLGNSQPLSDLDEFVRVRQVLDQDYLAFGYFNPFPSENLRNTIAQAGVPAQMIGEQGAGGFLVAADEPGLRIETVVLDAADNAASSPLSDSLVLSQTPDNAIAFLAGTDLASTQILDVLGAVFLNLAGLAPPPDPTLDTAEEQLDSQYARAASQIGVNLRSELFQRLSGEYGVWLERDDASGVLNVLFAAGADDPDSVSGALTQITLLVQGSLRGGGTVGSRAVGDTRVYSVETGDPTVPRVEYGVVGDQLVVGLGSAVDHVDTLPEPSLADDDRFQALMDALPVPMTGLMFVDLEQAIPLLSDAGGADVEAMAEDLEAVADTATDDAPEPVPARTGDAADECANFASQEEAQGAYDAFEPGSFTLDQDFDGEACEDYFNLGVVPAATPTSGVSGTENAAGAAIDEAAGLTDAVTAFGLVAYDEDGNRRTTSLILIDGQDE